LNFFDGIFCEKEQRRELYEGLVARQDNNCEEDSGFWWPANADLFAADASPCQTKITSELSLQKGFCDWKAVYVQGF